MGAAFYEKNHKVGVVRSRAYRLEIKYKERLRPLLVAGMAHYTYLDGYHGVPNVNVNSNGDFNFNLGNFENVWNDNNAFFGFSDYVILSPLSFGGESFF